MVEFVRTSLLALAAYGVLGLFFAFVFHLRGLHTLDTGSRGTGLGFRLLITPGIVALWPLLAWRWRAARRGGSFLGGTDSPVSARQLRATHALAWKALALTAPVMVAAALWWRPKEAPSSRIPTSSHAPSAAGSANHLKRGNASAFGVWSPGLP